MADVDVVKNETIMKPKTGIAKKNKRNLSLIVDIAKSNSDTDVTGLDGTFNNGVVDIGPSGTTYKGEKVQPDLDDVSPPEGLPVGRNRSKSYSIPTDKIAQIHHALDTPMSARTIKPNPSTDVLDDPPSLKRITAIPRVVITPETNSTTSTPASTSSNTSNSTPGSVSNIRPIMNTPSTRQTPPINFKPLTLDTTIPSPSTSPTHPPLSSSPSFKLNLNLLKVKQQDHSRKDTLASPRIAEIQLKDLKKIGIVGEGGQGVVEVVIHIPTSRLFALKKIWVNLDDTVEAKKQQRLLSNEVKTMIESDKSSYVVKFIQAFYTSQSQIQILLEYMDGGSLADLYKTAGKIPEKFIAQIAFQVLSGLDYLHNTRHVVHRDIKPANILVKRNGRIKIADLGIARSLGADSLARTRLGTLTYLSPERLSAPDGYSYASDIWSLGVTLCECALGSHPYPNAALFELLNSIVVHPPISKWLNCLEFSPEFISFVIQCMRTQPNERATAKYLLQHPFIAKYVYIGKDDFAEWVVNHLPVKKYL